MTSYFRNDWFDRMVSKGALILFGLPALLIILGPGGASCRVTSADCSATDSSCNDAVGLLLLASFSPGSTSTVGGTPTLTVTSGLILWLKADALTSLSDNDPVTRWNDSSGQGYIANASMPPNYKTNVINGLPVVVLLKPRAPACPSPVLVAAR